MIFHEFTPVTLTNQSALGKPRVQVRTFCSLITATLVLNGIVVFEFVSREEVCLLTLTRE